MIPTMMRALLFPGLLLFGQTLMFADQFTLFDETFTFEEKDAVPTKSHLFVKAPEQMAHWPTDWTSPVDYRNGTVHVRIEVLEKPAGDEPTIWSLCYIANKGAKPGEASYGCTNTPVYTEEGIYEKSAKMAEFWHNDHVDWTAGLKMFSLVLKGKPVPGDDGKSHAHLREDLSKFFPTKVRVTIVQVSANDDYDPKLVEKK